MGWLVGWWRARYLRRGGARRRRRRDRGRRGLSRGRAVRACRWGGGDRSGWRCRRGGERPRLGRGGDVGARGHGRADRLLGPHDVRAGGGDRAAEQRACADEPAVLLGSARRVSRRARHRRRGLDPHEPRAALRGDPAQRASRGLIERPAGAGGWTSRRIARRSGACGEGRMGGDPSRCRLEGAGHRAGVRPARGRLEREGTIEDVCDRGRQIGGEASCRGGRAGR